MNVLSKSRRLGGSCLPGNCKQVPPVLSHAWRARMLHSRPSITYKCIRHRLNSILSSFGQQTSTVYTNEQQARRTSSGSYSRMQQFDDQLYASRLEPTVGPVAVFVTPGAGLGLFTTRPVNPGDLLLVSKPLATVSLNPDATSSGPSKLIQTLLTQLLNPGQIKWLQILSDRNLIAQQQLLLHGSVNSGQGDLGDLRSDHSVEISTVIDLAQIQGLAAAGGKLERLQLTPMQLADMVQECAYTLDPEDLSLTRQLMAAAAAGSGNLGSESLAADQACCGLWPELALMNRSCAPNVTVTLAADGQSVLLRAADNMPAGTQLFLSQLQPSSLLLLPVTHRQQYLSQGSGLSCVCSRCSAEADLLHLKPALQPLLAALCTTAAAATAAMTNGNDHTQQQQQQRYYGSDNVVLESEGGAAPAAAAGSSGNGSREYDGDDWMFSERSAQPDKQAAASSSRDGSSEQYSAFEYSSYMGSSSGSKQDDVVITADYTLLDAAAAAAATDNGVAAAAAAGVAELEQQQRRAVAVGWLQRLVIDLLELQQVATAADGDTNLLLTAAAGSSWAAVRQALVILSSSSSSSDGSNSSSCEQLLRTQLHYLLTEADLAPITGSSSSDLNYQELLIRVYDLEIQTLSTIMPGTLPHVMATTAAAAMAAALAQARFERSDFGFDRWSNFDQGVYQQFYQVAGGFIDTKHRAVAAKFGRLSIAGQQQLVAAARQAAVAANVMPAAAATAAGSGNLTNIRSADSNSSSSNGRTQQQQQQQQQQRTQMQPDMPQSVSNTEPAQTRAEIKPSNSYSVTNSVSTTAAADVSNDASSSNNAAAAAAAATAAVDNARLSDNASPRKSRWHKMSLEDDNDSAAAAAAAAAAAPVYRKSRKWEKASMEDDTSYVGSGSSVTSSLSSGSSSLDSSSESEVYEAEASVHEAAAAAADAHGETAQEPMTAAAADEAAAEHSQAPDPEAAAAAAAEEEDAVNEQPEVVEAEVIMIDTNEPTAAAAAASDVSAAAAAVDDSTVSEIVVDVESATPESSSSSNISSSNSSSSSRGHKDPKDWWSAAKAAAAAAFARSSAAAAAAAEAATGAATDEAPEVVLEYDSLAESAAASSSSSSSGTSASSSTADSDIVTGSDGDWWSAAAAQSDSAAAGQRPASPSWLSPAARAAAEAAAAAATAASSSRDTTPAISMSEDGDDLLETKPQQQQQRSDRSHADVAAEMTQPWTRGPPASWIRSGSSAASSSSSTLSGDDFDYLNSTEELEVSPASQTGSSSSSSSSADASVQYIEAEYVDVTVEADMVTAVDHQDHEADKANISASNAVVVEAETASVSNKPAVNQQTTPTVEAEVVDAAAAGVELAQEGLAVAEAAAAAEVETEEYNTEQLHQRRSQCMDNTAPQAAAEAADSATVESAADAVIPPADYPLSAESASRLQQLIEWTVEVAGPLTASQEALVSQLMHGSSNGSLSESSSSASEDGKGCDVKQQQQQRQWQQRGVLDREQVQLLRQLLGLV